MTHKPIRLETLSAICLLALCLHSMPIGAQDNRPHTFEAATVRRNNEGGYSIVGVRVQPGGSVTAQNVSLRRIISFAYGLDAHQTVEGTAPVLDQNFDVLAKAGVDAKPAPFAEVGPINLMMQSLLAERFGLAVRWENSPQQGYALVRSGSGEALGAGLRPSDLVCPLAAGAPPPTGGRRCMMSVINNEMVITGRSMQEISRFLTTSLRRPVVDQTQLAGRYDVQMTFDGAELLEFLGMKPVRTPGAALPSIFTAVQEQLGLKLEARRIDVPTLIVERVEVPVEN